MLCSAGYDGKPALLLNAEVVLILSLRESTWDFMVKYDVNCNFLWMTFIGFRKHPSSLYLLDFLKIINGF
jgi:hypothetical protein